MVYAQAAYRGYQIAKRVYGYAKPTLTQSSFVGRFPPNYRNTVRTILKGSEIAFAGGLISDIAKDLMTGTDETTGGSQRSRPKTNKFKQGNYRRNIPYRRSGNYNKNGSGFNCRQLHRCLNRSTYRR